MYSNYVINAFCTLCGFVIGLELIADVNLILSLIYKNSVRTGSNALRGSTSIWWHMAGHTYGP